MLTRQEILLGMVLPAAVSLVIAAIGTWRRWAPAMPLAAGLGFLAAYGGLSVPKLPPVDGNDWLFWLALPLTLAGATTAIVGWKWGWALSALAGLVAGVILRPLNGVSETEFWGVSAGLALVGALLGWTLWIADQRTGSIWTEAAIAVALAGAGVIVFSSGSRTIGIEGIAASAAMGPVVVLAARVRAIGGVAVVAIPLFAGILVAGHFYANVTWMQMTVLLLSPGLIALGAIAPVGQRPWLRGALGLLMVLVAVAAVTVPAALAAKRAAEADPYTTYYK